MIANHMLRTGRERPNSHGSGLATASTLAIALGLLASAAPVAAQTAQPSRSTDSQSGDIIVTAQRRDQRITDVPYNITAVTAENITASGATNGNDLGKVVAGLGSFASGAADAVGENNFTLRGLRTDSVGQSFGLKLTASSVATYYGDTPVFFPILLKDLERVEVLRGPQGTLYGSGAQGGAIRFIPKRPSFDKISGEVNASAGITYSASQPNWSADGVINLPLADNLALRVSGAYVRQAGFIDQVNLFELDANGVPVPSVLGDLTSGPVIAPIKKNTNSTDQWMVRAALRYQPTDWLELEVSYLHQDTHSEDRTESNAAYQGGVRDLSINRAVSPPMATFPNASYQTRPGGKYRNTQPRLQPTTAKLDLFAGTAAFDLGFAGFSSITSYYKSTTRSTAEGSSGYVNPAFNFASGYNHYPRFTVPLYANVSDKGFSQEFRLVSQGDSPFSYVLGAYYQKQTKINDMPFVSPGLQAFSNVVCPGPNCLAPGANPQLTDVVFDRLDRLPNSELAAFGELTYHITKAWQVTGGIRVFKTKSSASLLRHYPFFGAPYGDGFSQPISQGTTILNTAGSTSDKVFKVNTSYDIDPDNMVYATFAQGFRRGGSNQVATAGPSASLPQYTTFKPDFADNYEIGIKGRALGRKLTYSIAGFWINQKDFQFTASTPSFYTAVFNGNKLRSRGVEIEGSFRVTPDLTLSGSYVYTDSKAIGATVIRDLATRSLLDGFQPGDVIVNPNATVKAGAILPGVSKHSAIAAIDYGLPLAGESKLIVHANANYRSKQNNTIAVASTNFFVLPSVFTADARITYDSGQSWSASLFVTNLTNAIGYGGTQGVQQTQNISEPQALIYASRFVTQPRTFGLNLHYGF